MDYQIKTERPWRYRHPKQGFALLQPGVHSVPEDLPRNLAELCVEQGMGRKMNPPATKAEAKVEEAEPPKRKRGRPRKTPAPENKTLHVAENK